jgi:uncharacterized protein YjiK
VALARHAAVTDLRPICALLAAVCGCAAVAEDAIDPYYESTKSDGARPKLKLRDDDKLHVDEPSDLAFANGRLFTVSDRHSKIYEISKGGDVVDELDVAARDLEALAVDGEGRFAIADENDTKVWFVNEDGERTHAFEIDDVDDGNSGIEGLAFDDAGHLYVAKEKDPARIYQLDQDGHEVARKQIELADDLSALAWNPRDGHLYALSDIERSLFRLDKDFEADAAWRLPVEHPEGIAFDGKSLYVVSDSEQRIYEFELDSN